MIAHTILIDNVQIKQNHESNRKEQCCAEIRRPKHVEPSKRQRRRKEYGDRQDQWQQQPNQRSNQTPDLVDNTGEFLKYGEPNTKGYCERGYQKPSFKKNVLKDLNTNLCKQSRP